MLFFVCICAKHGSANHWENWPLSSHLSTVILMGCRGRLFQVGFPSLPTSFASTDLKYFWVWGQNSIWTRYPGPQTTMHAIKLFLARSLEPGSSRHFCCFSASVPQAAASWSQQTVKTDAS